MQLQYYTPQGFHGILKPSGPVVAPLLHLVHHKTGAFSLLNSVKNRTTSLDVADNLGKSVGMSHDFLKLKLMQLIFTENWHTVIKEFAKA